MRARPVAHMPVVLSTVIRHFATNILRVIAVCGTGEPVDTPAACQGAPACGAAVAGATAPAPVSNRGLYWAAGGGAASPRGEPPTADVPLRYAQCVTQKKNV
jgi:hypothetical protein